MEISEKLAFEIYTIEIFHIIALLLILGFTFYIYLKTKKSALFFSYAIVVGMLALWMLSKILKTVAPNEGLRWFFIVSQYLGIQFLGLSVIIFSVYLTKNRLINRRLLIFLLIVPVTGFLVVLTNPIHKAFYSYYDFYKDSFGFLFYPITVILYIYLFTGIFMLSRKFTSQPHFKNRLLASRCFAGIILFAVFGNIYYLLVKLTDIPYVFPFPFFDFTPITSAIALMLFILPAYKYRFLDLTPIAYVNIFEQLPDGIVFIKNSEYLFSPNTTFRNMFWNTSESFLLESFISNLDFETDEEAVDFNSFIKDTSNDREYFFLKLKSPSYYKVYKEKPRKNQSILRFKDISKQVLLQQELEQDVIDLQENNQNLSKLADALKELAITQAHSKVSQDIHDILGHSLTVVIGIADLAASTNDPENAKQKISQINELLSSSVSDLQSSLTGKPMTQHTTLIKAIQSLSNDNILLDLSVQGKSIELNSSQTEAIFRVCQEAMTNSIKHGNAENILINLRFKPNELELYIIDDGSGCSCINQGYGIKGIIRRMEEIGGTANIGSDGEKGFNIHITLPL